MSESSEVEMGHLVHFFQGESGATALEYGLIASLVVLTMLLGFQAFGDAMLDMYSGSEDSLTEVIESSSAGGGGE